MNKVKKNITKLSFGILFTVLLTIVFLISNSSQELEQSDNISKYEIVSLDNRSYDDRTLITVSKDYLLKEIEKSKLPCEIEENRKNIRIEIMKKNEILLRQILFNSRSAANWEYKYLYISERIKKEDEKISYSIDKVKNNENQLEIPVEVIYSLKLYNKNIISDL